MTIQVTKSKSGAVYSDKMVTPPGRLSYPHLFSRSSFNGEEGKFETTLYIPKKADITKILDAAERAGKLAFDDKWKGLDSLKNPLVKDGDESDDENAKGCWVIRAKTDSRPEVVGPTKENLEEGDIYGGCWARLSVVIGSYNFAGNWGLSFYLNNVQKLKDDERFGGGRSSAANDFEAFEEAIDF